MQEDFINGIFFYLGDKKNENVHDYHHQIKLPLYLMGVGEWQVEPDTIETSRLESCRLESNGRGHSGFEHVFVNLQDRVAWHQLLPPQSSGQPHP